MVKVDNKAVLSTSSRKFFVPRTLDLPFFYIWQCATDLSVSAMASPAPPVPAKARTPTPERPQKERDYILALLYILVYLEVGWLTIMIWRSCH